MHEALIGHVLERVGLGSVMRVGGGEEAGLVYFPFRSCLCRIIGVRRF